MGSYRIFTYISFINPNSGNPLNPNRLLEPCFIPTLHPAFNLSMEFVEYEPEYIPEAVMNYYSCGVQVGRSKTNKDLILKAKKHLSAIGWSFFYICKKPGRRELRYRSPAGKTYCSLRSACQDHIDHHQDDHDLDSCCSKTESFTEKKTKLEKNDEFLRTSRPQKRIQIEDDHDLDLGCSKTEIFTEKKTKVEKHDDLSNSLPQKRIRIRDDHDLGSGSSQIEIFTEQKTHRPRKRIRIQDVEASYFDRKREESGVDSNDDVGIVEDDKSAGFLSDRPGKKIKRLMEYSGKKKNEFKPKKQIRKMADLSTRRRCVLSMLIERKIVFQGSKVAYRSRKDGRVMAEGRAYEDGIQCDCCGEFFLLSKFEAHAGSTYRRPAANIFLDDGRSLLDCQTQLTHENEPKSTKSCDRETGQDDFCSFCNDGGELLLCDSCTSSFHASCIGLNGVPDSDYWFCPSCCCQICLEDQISLFTNEDSQIKCKQCAHYFHTDCLRKKGVLVTSDTVNWSDGDVVEHVIFSRSSERSNFNGFFTAVLERDEEMITVVAVRVHGCKAAEIPLVATRFRYRKMGMCRILMDEIERIMKELGVERLVLPAVPEMVRTWKESFGFKVMDEMERLKLIDCKFLDFPGTIKCQKILEKM
ncbi:Acyl-CoA N-acyltransferase [Cynara cardunculus var. scolymus]|uniref:Acyl-CoA N-acyltransferase n=1 Tax=Cynara cardunculus var. scolymus TaxID=59895 RepID=A0A103VYG2_CYNCS|nr:Acyl-CoA N-acyltransferase [Cynara cardunculus var. scolymus]